MPDADPSETVTTASDGVTVEKSFEPDDFPVPAIAFDLHSTRDTAASVRLVDTVPDDVGPEEIGFHPKYGAEFWDVDGDEIVFERELAPEESYTTVYGLRGGDAAVAATFLSEPRLETVSPAVGTSGDASGTSIPTTETDEPRLRDEFDETGGPSLDSDPVDGPESSNHDEFDPDQDVPADPAPSHDPTPGDDFDPSDGAGSTDGITASMAQGDRLLGALAEELEEADPDDPDLAALRAALGVEPSASVETRIEHLQSTVADLEAYTDALETFLDENGDARAVIADLREQHDKTVGRVDEVEATAEDAVDGVEAVRADVEALEAEVASLSSELEAVLEMRDRLAKALGGASSGGSAPRGGGAAVGADAGRTDTDPRTADPGADTDSGRTTAPETDPEGPSDRE